MRSITLHFARAENLNVVDRATVDQAIDEVEAHGMRFDYATDENGEEIDLDDDFFADAAESGAADS